jgi:hypothetical protein
MRIARGPVTLGRDDADLTSADIFDEEEPT